MGYYTNFTLNIDCVDDSQRSTLEREIEKMGVFEGGDIEDGITAEAKWYDCDEDMLLLSSRFQDILFSLYGSGDNSDDIWLHYFKNGRAMFNGIEVVYNDFDESKLSEDRVPDGKLRYSYEED